MDYRGFKGVTVSRRVYKRIERVTADYNGFLGLQGIPRGEGSYDGLQGVT